MLEMDGNIGVYLRVSTNDQSKTGYGLNDQLIQCKKYIDLYYSDMNEDNIKIYKDEGYSAKSLERPALKALLKDVEAGKVNIIIVYKLDRISRNVVDTYTLIQFVGEHRCSLIAVADRIDISSANSRLITGMLSVISQYEREVILERTTAALLAMARKGKYPSGGCAPFGWAIQEDNTLVVDRGKAEIVNYMADCYLEGYSLQDVSVMVKEKYNLSYNWRRIKQIVQRPQNIGIYYYQGHKFDNIFPAIMDVNKFEKIKNAAKYREHHSLEKNSYIFYGLVYCCCGKRTQHVCTVKHGKNKITVYRYYYCSNCNKRVLQKKLENEIVQKVFVGDVFDIIKERKKLIDKKIVNVQRKIRYFMDALYNDEITEEMYSITVKGLENKLAHLEDCSQGLNIQYISEYHKMSEFSKYELLHNLISKIDVDTKSGIVTNVDRKKL